MSSPKEPTKSSSQKPAATKRDKFVPFLVAFALLSLIGIGIAIYMYWHKTEKKEIPESYMALPEIVIDSDTQVVRLKVSIQVNTKDQEWVKKNTAKINQIFKESIQNIDSDDFRNHVGREAIQEQLKDELNKQLQVDKVQAVLYQDLLMQSK